MSRFRPSRALKACVNTHAAQLRNPTVILLFATFKCSLLLPLQVEGSATKSPRVRLGPSRLSAQRIRRRALLSRLRMRTTPLPKLNRALLLVTFKCCLLCSLPTHGGTGGSVLQKSNGYGFRSRRYTARDLSRRAGAPAAVDSKSGRTLTAPHGPTGHSHCPGQERPACALMPKVAETSGPTISSRGRCVRPPVDDKCRRVQTDATTCAYNTSFHCWPRSCATSLPLTIESEAKSSAGRLSPERLGQQR